MLKIFIFSVFFGKPRLLDGYFFGVLVVVVFVIFGWTPAWIVVGFRLVSGVK